MRDAQAAIAITLLHGPDHLPAGMFAGDTAAVLRGLRVHANTISHARLVALEESFPRTRDYLGEAEFNRQSRAFVEEGGSQGRSLTDIGAAFPEWFADPLAADLARVERAWLESYHAEDAPVLALPDLAGLGEAGLLDLRVKRHPGVRVVALASPAAPLIDAALAPDTTALLVTRPDAEVRLFPLHAAAAAALAMADEFSPLGNVIAHLAELHPEGGTAIAALIGAGAFEKA
ncbi:DNA-binding domain-containing protein [Sphingopyxis sp.]|uniref:DNA-binding domain-containing protein n=1 Tax=Sphingopyxis sp. TaxID=1908224 RepID=UPI002ED917C0